MIVPGSELDSIERDELRRQDRHERQCRHKLSQHPDPRDPDHPEPDSEDESERICIGCGKRHPFNADGTPVGGALPCGH